MLHYASCAQVLRWNLKHGKFDFVRNNRNTSGALLIGNFLGAHNARAATSPAPTDGNPFYSRIHILGIVPVEYRIFLADRKQPNSMNVAIKLEE